MNITLLSLKKLRYKPLPHLLGHKVTIARIAETETAVLRELDPELAKHCKIQESNRQLALLLTKYGFLDLTFEAPLQNLNNHQRPTRSTLAELQFIDSGTGGAKEDPACLETLIEGIEEGKCWLRLFLFGEPATDTLKRIFEQYRKDAQLMRPQADVESTMFRMEKVVSQMADRVNQRLPMTFVIQDACLTNCDAIWLASHGYL